VKSYIGTSLIVVGFYIFYMVQIAPTELPGLAIGAGAVIAQGVYILFAKEIK